MNRALHQRCWNHENRAAVCRCPECGRSFCQECVAEHEGRFLCAGCLKTAAHVQPREPANRRFTSGSLVLAGVLLAWSLFFFTGEAVMTFFGRLEQMAWLNR